MITPEYLSYTLDTLTVQKQLETSIIQDIARRIVKSGVVTETADYQAERAQAAGILYGDLVREVSKAADMTESEIAYAFEDAASEVFNYPEPTLKSNGINPAEFKRMSPAMQKLWDAALSKTTTEAVNLTKTTAAVSQSLFIQACDLAHMQVAGGAFDYKTAIANAVKTAAAQGARVVYPTGHITSLYAAVRRAVLTGVNQTAGRLQEMRAGEYGVDLMEISAHGGARPSHAAWQGRIVSLSGRRGYLTTDDIQYGDVRGFMGANCRHTWYMFFEGDTPANSEEYLRELRDRSVTYGGKAVPEYEASQIQRGMERNIRKSKNSLAGLDAAANAAEEIGDNELAASLKRQFAAESVRLKEKEAKLKDFCAQTGRDADSSRMQALGFDRSVSSKAVWANKKELENIKNRDIIKERLNSGDIKLEINREKQNRHIRGTNDYKEGRSYLTISVEEAQKIINQYHATGDININKNGQIREIVCCRKEIGVSISQFTREETPTIYGKIHYSKTGTHIVPYKENQ